MNFFISFLILLWYYYYLYDRRHGGIFLFVLIRTLLLLLFELIDWFDWLIHWFIHSLIYYLYSFMTLSFRIIYDCDFDNFFGHVRLFTEAHTALTYRSTVLYCTGTLIVLLMLWSLMCEILSRVPVCSPIIMGALMTRLRHVTTRLGLIKLE